MSRQLEKGREDRQRKLDEALIAAVEFGIVQAIENSGREFGGFSVRYGSYECLATVRAKGTNGAEICFVGAPDMADLMRKLQYEIKTDQVTWRADKYREEQS